MQAAQCLIKLIADSKVIEPLSSPLCDDGVISQFEAFLVQPVKLPNEPLQPVSHNGRTNLATDRYPDPAATPNGGDSQNNKMGTVNLVPIE